MLIVVFEASGRGRGYISNGQVSGDGGDVHGRISSARRTHYAENDKRVIRFHNPTERS